MTARSISRSVAVPFARGIVGRLASEIWTPAKLFAAGQQGLWLDTLPMYLCEDIAGTIEDVVNGDPVGLGLERSEGLELGPELVTNGAFDTDVSGWDPGKGSEVITWESGKAKVSFTDVGDAGLKQVFSRPAGVAKVTATITCNYTGATHCRAETADGDSADVPISFGETKTLSFTARRPSSGLSTIRVRTAVGIADGYFTVDDISAKEILGNHLTQATSADRPTYNTDGSLHWLAHDGAGDNLKTTYASAVTQPCTLSIAIDKKDTGVSKTIVTGLSSTDRHELSINASGNLVAAAGSTVLDSAAGLANGKHVVTAVIDGANSSIRVDGVVVATGDLGSASSGGLTLSALWDGTLSITQDAYGIVHAGGIDSVGRIESYLADKVGITL